MMMVADKVLCVQLASVSKWTCLYWWNYEDKKWKLGSTKLGPKSVPAYNFDFLFEKLQPVFLLQDDDQLLQAFKLLLVGPNPANSLSKLAIELATKGLLHA